MFTTTKAIVLHAIKYGESQLIVDMLTEREGRLSFIVRLSRSAKGSMRKQTFQPLTIVDLTFDHRPSLSLQHIKEVRVGMPYLTLPYDARKLSLALFVAEFLNYATRHEQFNESLFQYVETALCWLDAAEEGVANFHLTFMMRLTQFIGFFPNLSDYVEGDWFDLRNGCFVHVSPGHDDVVPPLEASRIHVLMRMRLESMRLFKMSREERNRCMDYILKYYRLHVPSFPELRSVGVVRELFV